MERYVAQSSSMWMDNCCGPGLPSLMCYSHEKGLCLGDQRKKEGWNNGSWRRMTPN